MQLQTGDLDQAIEAVRTVYCPHQLRLDRRATSLNTRLNAVDTGEGAVVRLAYGAPVEVDAGHFPDIFLFMRCAGGEGRVRQAGATGLWHVGSTIPVSAGLRTAFDFGATFEQATFRPNTARLEALCARLLGHPLDEVLRFELSPFSPELERTWTQSIELAETLHVSTQQAARLALEEFMLLAVLTGHRHNFSQRLGQPQPVMRQARLVARAQAYFHDHEHDLRLTVSEVAAAMGVSMRTLQSAFQNHINTTPTVYLRQLRLAQARRQLQAADESASVTDIALAHGFFHLSRFAQHYKSQFGESPSDTLRTTRMRLGTHTGTGFRSPA